MARQIFRGWLHVEIRDAERAERVNHGVHDRSEHRRRAFHAFLKERQAIGARGRHWLFFGNPRRASDFLFEDELIAYCRDGLLDRLDTAFSRDQPQKIYVQHRMLEHAAELWTWLEDGAHLYACGDAERMARDVDRGLAYIVGKEGGMDMAGAKAYLARLAREGHYARDVY
jgi:sulfite reductase (NADPH) flavoprotein alpha-component